MVASLRPIICLSLALAVTSNAAAQVETFHHLPIEGYSQPGRLAKVAAATMGILEHFNLQEGQSVTAGQCIASLDDAVHSEIVEIARITMESNGELASAKAELQARHTRLTRIESLVRREHASQVEWLQAREQVSLAEANLLIAREKQQQREAEYQKLLAEANEYCIQSPFDGVVVEFLKEQGEYVGPADPHICVLAQLAELSIEFLVPRPRRAEVSLNASAKVLFVDTNQSVTGRVTYISPYPNGETNLYTVKVRVKNGDRKLDAGMRCHLVDVTPDN